MDLIRHRKRLGLSQSDVAAAIGLSATSKGRICEVEAFQCGSPTGRPAGLSLALAIEVWSDGEVDADGLVTRADAALLAAHCRFAASRSVNAAA